MKASPPFLNWFKVIVLVYVLIVAVGVLSQGFRAVSGGAEGAERIFEFATNPLVGVLLGILATALVQSSSAVTSVIVGLVGGGLSIAIAIPMIMGSNMGTTITNTLAALGNLREDEAFSRSFAAATIHDFFNVFTILIFLPLELLFHPLENLSGWMAGLLSGSGDVSVANFDFIRFVTRPTINAIRDGIRLLPANFSGLTMIVVGIFMVLLMVYLLNQVLQSAMTGKARQIFQAAVGKNAGYAIITGLIVTFIVQSSTLTTVLIVPLAGAGVMTLAQVYPFTLGANIGTPITAIMTATAISGEYEIVALQVAFVHLLYNLLAVILFALIPPLWRLPVQAAQALANAAIRSRWVVPAYILGVFIVLPGIVFTSQSLSSRINPEVIEADQKQDYTKLQEEADAKGLAIE